MHKDVFSVKQYATLLVFFKIKSYMLVGEVGSVLGGLPWSSVNGDNMKEKSRVCGD